MLRENQFADLGHLLHDLIEEGKRVALGSASGSTKILGK
jgi:hypothetical protein